MTQISATPTVQVDNERMIVTEWRFPPGGATGYHRHRYDYCVVPITTGKLRIDRSDGSSESELISGRSYFRRAGVEHNVINANPFEFVFIEIELREPPHESEG
jgi:quercetin dioxygenase-like cupin family protein